MIWQKTDFMIMQQAKKFGATPKKNTGNYLNTFLLMI